MDENDELLDLADAQDTVVDTIRRGDMVKLGYQSPKGYVRFAVAFIVNSENKIWVPIRGMHKSIAPGSPDFSVAEHVHAGETYAQAIERAFAEEAGMHIAVKQLVPIAKLGPTDNKPTHETIFAYFIRDTEHPVYSQEEFTSASWLALSEFESTVTSGPPTKSALLPAFTLLKTYLGANQKATGQ